MINVDNVSEAVEELERAKALGLNSCFITVYPQHEHQYHNPEYDPFWDAAQSLNLPISLHSGSDRDFLPMNLYDPADVNQPLGVIYSTNDYWIRRSLTSMIWSGVFERFPNLKVASIENRGGLGRPVALQDGLAPPRSRHDVAALQGQHEAQRLLPPQLRHRLSGGLGGPSSRARPSAWGT